MKGVYKDNHWVAAEGDMAEQDREESSQQQTAAEAEAESERTKGKRSRPLAGFFIAGASLALLFGLAALKGRVKDDNTDRERGLD